MTSATWARRGGRVLVRAFDALVPPSCVLCRRGLESGRPPLCALCRHRLPRLPSPRCARCAEPAGWPLAGHGPRPARGLASEGRAAGALSPSSSPSPTATSPGCPACVEWPQALRVADAPYVFEGHAADLVKALKYEGWQEVARPMGRTMAPVARGLADVGSSPVLVPVPLAPARLRERGFNQAERLAAAVAAEVGWPVREALVRRSGGGRQARLARAGRRENVRERFAARGAVGGEGRRAVLVDDVLTTGATAAACARALGQAGFRDIVLVTFARTLRPAGGNPRR